MRTPRKPLYLAALAAAVAAAAFALIGCPANQAPQTTCTGPDPGDDGAPVERLPFDGSGLDADCDVDGPGGDGDVAHVRGKIAGDENTLLEDLGCTSGTINVDFGNTEVLILDVPDTFDVDALFDVKGALVAAVSTSDACRGAPPQVLRQITVLQRTGDDEDLAIRSCVTTGVDDGDGLECP